MILQVSTKVIHIERYQFRFQWDYLNRIELYMQLFSEIILPTLLLPNKFFKIKPKAKSVCYAQILVICTNLYCAADSRYYKHFHHHQFENHSFHTNTFLPNFWLHRLFCHQIVSSLYRSTYRLLLICR